MTCAAGKKAPIGAVLFDKDGTLFDFRATWDAWTATLIYDYSQGDMELSAALAGAIGYDLATGQLRADSPVVASTNRHVAALLAAVLPGRDVDWLDKDLAHRAARTPAVAPTPLGPLLCNLAARGLALGVMTNDSEFSARAQLKAAGIAGMFDFIAGSDSGYGEKPDPDPLWAFAEHVGVSPDRVVMVGDSLHDLMAGRAAGMRTLAVLTGVVGAEVLAPYADAVLQDIGDIPAWIDQ